MLRAIYKAIIFIVLFCTSLDGFTSTVRMSSPKEDSYELRASQAAAFALAVYEDKKHPDIIPVGFKLLTVCPDELKNNHYYGEAYYRIDYDSKNHKIPVGVTVVIAHRGTKLNKDNILDDINIALKQAPMSYLTSSRPFTKYVTKLAFEKFPVSEGYLTHQFVQVGHSLGAIHAELNNVAMHMDMYEPGKPIYPGDLSVTAFEDPGSQEIIDNLVAQGVITGGAELWIMNTTILNTDANVINTANRQTVSYIERIYPGYEFLNLPNVNISPIDIKYFVTLFTLDQHNMEKIYNYLKSKPLEICEPAFSPVGIVDAFKYYRQYEVNDPCSYQHKKYWDLSLKKYWDHHEEIHSGYHNSFNEYKEYMVKNYLS